MLAVIQSWLVVDKLLSKVRFAGSHDAQFQSESQSLIVRVMMLLSVKELKVA